LTIRAAPTELKALTKCAAGNALELFHERLFEIGKEGEYAVDGRAIVDGVAGVDDGLSGEVGRAGQAQGFGCYFPADGKHEQFAESRGVGKAAEGRGGVLCGPVGQFAWGSGAHLHLMTMLEEAAC